MPLKPKSTHENMLLEYKPCLAHHKHTLNTLLMPKHTLKTLLMPKHTLNTLIMPKHKASKCLCLHSNMRLADGER